MINHLTEQYGYAYLPLSNYEIDPKLTKLIPAELARAHLVIPLDKIGNLLTVATANPLSLIIINLIKEKTGLSVQMVLSSISDLQEYIALHYPD